MNENTFYAWLATKSVVVDGKTRLGFDISDVIETDELFDQVCLGLGDAFLHDENQDPSWTVIKTIEEDLLEDGNIGFMVNGVPVSDKTIIWIAEETLRDGTDKRFAVACDADRAAGELEAPAQQPAPPSAPVELAMLKVAAIAHSGGLIDMSPHDALTAIRHLTLPYWGKEEKPEQVHAALAQQ